MAKLKVGLGKIKDVAGGGMKAVQSGVARIDVGARARDAKNLANVATASAAELAKGIKRAPSEANENDGASDYRNFFALLWCVASVDGEVSPEEKERIYEIALGMDEGYGAYAEDLERECLLRLRSNERDFGWQSGVKVEAQRALEALPLSRVEAKLVCWNLLAVATFGGLGKEEIDFVRFVGSRAGVSSSDFEELLNYAFAIVDIAKTRESLRESNRRYSEVEPLVSELAKREQAVLKAAQALVADE